MSVFRINKTKSYTVMSNHHLKTKDMSLKAKGLLCMMLSLPDDWDYSINGLVSLCKEDVRAVRGALKELCDFGYVKIVKLYPNQTDSKKIEYVYHIFEQPQKEQDTQKQGIQNVHLQNVAIQNDTQLNTNKSSTKDKEKERGESRFAPPSVDEVKAYCDQRHNGINPQHFIDFYVSKGWMIGKNKMRDWKAAIRTWETREKQNPDTPKREFKTKYDDCGLPIIPPPKINDPEHAKWRESVIAERETAIKSREGLGFGLQ